MKIYKDKDGNITVLFCQGEEPKSVTIAQDRGAKNVGSTNMWGVVIERYLYHVAGVSRNTSYSSTTNDLLNETDVAYNLVKSKRQPPKKKTKKES